MKKLLLQFFVVMLATIAPAQNSSWFARVGLGTRATGDSFEGVSFGLEVGKSIGRWELSGGLTVYRSSLTDEEVGLGIKSIPGHTMIDIDTWDCQRHHFASLFVRAGYDVVPWVRQHSRHHLIPFVGVDYSMQDEISHVIRGDNEQGSVQLDARNEYGYGLLLGARYEVELGRAWALGLFYEYHSCHVKKDLMGISFRKAF